MKSVLQCKPSLISKNEQLWGGRVTTGLQVCKCHQNCKKIGLVRAWVSRAVYVNPKEHRTLLTRKMHTLLTREMHTLLTRKTHILLTRKMHILLRQLFNFQISILESEGDGSG